MHSSSLALAALLNVFLGIFISSRALKFDADNDYAAVRERLSNKRSDVTINGNEECMLATTAQIQALPGYTAALDKIAGDYGGRRPLNGQVNLDRYPSYQAQWCRTRTPVVCVVVPNSKKCSFNTATSTSTFLNVNGTLSQSLQTIISQTTLTTVTNTSQRTWEWTIEPSLKIGDIVEVGGSYSWGGSELKTTSQAFYSATTTASTEVTTIDVKAGQTCSIVTESTSCLYQYKASTQSYLKGWVIYQWDRAVTYTGQPKSNKHKTWMRWATTDWTPSGIISDDDLNIIYNLYESSVGKAVCVTT